MNTRQKLKRNISMDPQKDPPVKKPKTRKPLDTRYETPHPSVLSESQTYKLPSSVGPYLSPSDFSPIPRASGRRTHRKTSSTNLKENAVLGSSPFPKDTLAQKKLKKYGKSSRKAKKRAQIPLESPFNSSASSPSSSDSYSSEHRSVHDEKTVSRPASQSTNDLPTLAESPTKLRRPSAPTPPRLSEWTYKPSHTASAVDLHTSKTHRDPAFDADLPSDGFNPFIRPSPNHSQLDFNRPPSQLSLYDYNRSVIYDEAMEVDPAGDDEFFKDVRCTSTPFKHLGSLSLGERRVGGNVDPANLSRSFTHTSPGYEETDTDGESCGFDSDEEPESPGGRKSFFRTLKLMSRKNSQNGSGYLTPSEDSGDEEMGQRSPWISDSLISPPHTIDWKLLPKNPKKDAYMQVDEAKDEKMDEEKLVPKHGLQDLFDGLILNPATANTGGNHSPTLNDTESHPIHLPVRTRSLDDSLISSPANRDVLDSAVPLTIGTRRTRSGTIVATASSAQSASGDSVPTLPRRTRSGTVVPGNLGDAFVPSTTGAAPSILGGARRTRSGTVVSTSAGLAPSLPIVEERRSGASSSVSAIPVSARRARSGSIMAPSSIAEGSTIDSAAGPAVAPALGRIRSGSIVALGNTLANLPSQAVGIMKRSRSGTVTHAPTLAPAAELETALKRDNAGAHAKTLPQVIVNQQPGPLDEPSFTPDRDVEMSVHIPESDIPESGTTTVPHPGGTVSSCQPVETQERDPFDLLDASMDILLSPSSSSSHSASNGIAVANPRISNGLRARARAAASKAKGFSKALAGKNTRGKEMSGPEAGAAALARARERAERRMAVGGGSQNGEDSSDDELLLKKGMVIT